MVLLYIIGIIVLYNIILSIVGKIEDAAIKKSGFKEKVAHFEKEIDLIFPSGFPQYRKTIRNAYDELTRTYFNDHVHRR